MMEVLICNVFQPGKDCHYENELQCIAFRYWSNHESSAIRKKSNYMDGFENIYVIFSMNSNFVEKEHWMCFKIFNLWYIPFVYWYWIEVIFGLNVWHVIYIPYMLILQENNFYFWYALEFKCSLKSFVCKSNSGQHKLNEGLNQQIILKRE